MSKTQPMGCPCCEAESKISSKLIDMTALKLKDAPKLFQILCKTCGVSTPLFSSKENAIKIWNTRPNHNKVFRTFAV